MSSKKERVSLYNKQYYQQHKENWNTYVPETCELCNSTVTCMYLHLRTKKHRNNMRIRDLENQIVTLSRSI